MLAGGGSQIAGLAETLGLVLRLRVRLADRPLSCVALGTGEILRDRVLFDTLFPASVSLIGRWWRFLRSGMKESSSFSSR